MKNTRKLLVFLTSYMLVLISTANCENNTASSNNTTTDNGILESFGEELLEQGRTFVHGTLKRFMVIAPAIFFKLGIAFTLLLIVTLVAANNGFIGFLILVVGLSTVLSRFQVRPTPLVQHLPIPYSPIHALPHSAPLHHHPWIDRSDSTNDNLKGLNNNVVNTRFVQNQGYDANADLRNTGAYYGKYDEKVV